MSLKGSCLEQIHVKVFTFFQTLKKKSSKVTKDYEVDSWNLKEYLGISLILG